MKFLIFIIFYFVLFLRFNLQYSQNSDYFLPLDYKSFFDIVTNDPNQKWLITNNLFDSKICDENRNKIS